MTQQQEENVTKWLHTIHFSEKESFLCNRLKRKSPTTGYLSQFHCFFCFFFFKQANSIIMTQQQRENAAKLLHTRNFNEIEPFQRFLFVLSHEINNRQLNDDLLY